MHPLVKAMMKSKMGYAKGGLVKDNEPRDGMSSEALEIAKAIMAKVRPMAEDADDLFDGETQSPLPGGEMPSDDYREIEGEGAEREAMKKKGLVQLALEKAKKRA